MDVHTFLGPDLSQGLLVILMLVVIESVLSIDNAAVLATMVMGLPEHQRGKALKYGIIGAYFFRGLCLLLASYLMKIWWLEPLGGGYLLWLAWSHFTKKESLAEECAEAVAHEKESWLYRVTFGRLGKFWATVLAVEVMDLAFSIDNVLAAVAYVKNYKPPTNVILVCTGVFIGILAMRFAAQGFVKLMQRYPFLETSAFLVIGLLGLKLIVGSIAHWTSDTHPFDRFIHSTGYDLSVSLATLAIFVVPVVTFHLLGWPKRQKQEL